MYQEIEVKTGSVLQMLIKAQQEDHLIEVGTTEIAERTVRRCSEYYPCKRTSCGGCQERRRRYFVNMGTVLAHKKELNKHATITWPLQYGENPWERLLSLSSMISKNLTGRVGPFIRTLALGKKDTPHVHYLINSNFENRFYSLAKQKSPEMSRIFVDIKPVSDVSGLLDYFFVKNFTPSVNDPRRIKGMRLLSGSRDQKFTYSYPKTKHWKSYVNLGGRYEK